MVNITFGHARGKYAAIVDVAPGGVSMSVVVTRNGVSTTLATGHSPLSAEARTKKQAVTLLGQQIKEAGDLALKLFAEQGHSAPIEAVYAFVHAPWATSQRAQHSKKYTEDTLVTESLLSGIAQETFSTVAGIDTKRLLESAIARVEINGYWVHKPEGTRARSIDLHVLMSECDEEVKNTASGALGALFPVAKIAWRSGARAVTTFVDHSSLKGKDVLILDMTADSTHVMSARRDSFEQSIVEEGVATILARVAGGRMPEEVLGQIRMLNREACSSEACEAVEAAMSTAEPELARIFGEAIGKMAALRHVPNDLVLITHQDLEPWLSRFFTRIDFSQFTTTSLPFEVHTPQALGVSSWTTGDHQDPALAVDNALVNIEGDS